MIGLRREVSDREMSKRTRLVLLVALLSGTIPALEAQSAGAAAPDPAIAPVAQAGAPQTAINIFAGRSVVVSSAEPLKRVSVTDPAVASATIITPRQVLVHGHMPGGVTLILWDESEQMRSFELEVAANLRTLRDTIREVLPQERIEVAQSGDSVVLTGTVSSKGVGEQVVALAKVYSKNVVNLLSERSGQVLLQVRFAEVDRTAIEQLGLTLFSTGATNTLGVTSTQQFGQTLANIGAVPADVQRGRDPQAPSVVAGAKAVPPELSPAAFGLSDLLNVFFFRPDVNFGAAIRALKQRNLLEILAEPNLLARNGHEASFLAGGEFPFPTIQAAGGINAVTIQFREFGVRLKFTPNIQSDGTIDLKVLQEVSSLDFSNALTISGFIIPALSARRAETELQLRDGQSFAIAGLIDNRVTEVASKIPGLAHLPILGKLFQSRAKQKNKTELLALVTPRLVKPGEPGTLAPGVQFPEPFLDQKKPSQVGDGAPPADGGAAGKP